MSIGVKPLSPAVGAEVRGLDPAGRDICQADCDALVAAFLDYGVVLLRGLAFRPDAQIGLTRLFGEPDIHPIESIRLQGYPEIIELSTAAVSVAASDPTADTVIGQIPWHSDLTYTTSPSRGALLYAVEVPAEGGQTGFIDTARVYAELPTPLRRKIQGLEVIHSFDGAKQESRKQGVSADDNAPQLPDFPEVIQPLVLPHPQTGRPALNVSPMFARRIVGMSEARSDALLGELTAFATDERFVYVHEWRVGDLVIWDNFRTMHKAFGCKRKYRRVMYRTTIRGVQSTGRLAA